MITCIRNDRVYTVNTKGKPNKKIQKPPSHRVIVVFSILHKNYKSYVFLSIFYTERMTKCVSVQLLKEIVNREVGEKTAFHFFLTLEVLVAISIECVFCSSHCNRFILYLVGVIHTPFIKQHIYSACSILFYVGTLLFH